jgi:DNA-binding response OmpR family regulator
MSGLELAAALRGSHPGVPVILMSGAHDTGSNSSAVDAALAKPFKQQELARTIRLVLERRAAVAPVAGPPPGPCEDR